eukprot:s2757_g6.t1
MIPEYYRIISTGSAPPSGAKLAFSFSEVDAEGIYRHEHVANLCTIAMLFGVVVVGWAWARRFVLVQGTELKLRPIDDCLEAQLNLAHTVTSYLKLQDVDDIAGLALKIAERLVGQSVGPGSEQWLGKCLDLSKAYKQMGVHPEHRHLAVMALGGNPMRKGPADIVSFRDYAIQRLQAAKPRCINLGFERKPTLVFTDGCWEGNFACIGAVIVDVATGNRWVCKGETPRPLLDKWRVLVGDHLICQIELHVMVLIREFYSIDADAPSYSWIERVPSASNLADGPSRDACAEALALLGLERPTDFVHPEDLVARLLKLS